jgi:uncharacterized alkaline shock family protein YloU
MAETVTTDIRKDKVIIADEVISTIAGVAATNVECVVSLSGGFVDGIAGMLGKKNLAKGVKVEAGEKEVAIDLAVIVEYGCRIHVVAKNIQDVVRAAVEDMTGLTVVEINVNVVGINIDKDTKKISAETSVEEVEEQST